MIKQRQQGSYIVEFAAVGSIFLFMLFGAFEVARVMYTWSALDAATQRGARVAAVCPMNDAAIARIALFGTPQNAGTVIPKVDASNIAVAYLDKFGNTTANRGDVRFVSVGITNYTHQMLIPPLITDYISPNLLSPSFQTVRSSESLGFNPVTGAYAC